MSRRGPVAILVLGMHRSGTSALSGVLHRCGVALGSSMRAPHPGVNEKGYWEHLELVQLHDRLLTHLRSSWDEILPLAPEWWRGPEVRPFRDEIRAVILRDFRDQPVWGLKDPRVCRLLPLWTGLLDELGIEARFVLTHRAPGEVVRSLAKRDGFSAAKSALLWLEHHLAAERDSRGRPRAFTAFDRLLDDPLGQLDGIRAALGLEFPRSPAEAEPDIRAFLSPRLRHHHGREAAGDLAGLGELGGMVERCRDALDRACDGAEPGIESRFDAVRAELEARIERLDPALASHARDLQRRLAELTEYLQALQRTSMWRLGHRVRRLALRLRRGTR